jgi:hypothetical protein
MELDVLLAVRFRQAAAGRPLGEPLTAERHALAGGTCGRSLGAALDVLLSGVAIAQEHILRAGSTA